MTQDSQSGTTRRSFVKTSAAAAAAVTAGSFVPRVWGGRRDDELRIGIVGCGGRGTGAVNDTLKVNYGVKLVAMADLSVEICQRSRGHLVNEHGERAAVSDENMFGGLDAYQKVVNHPDVDLVILTTSPGFRPIQLAAAVAAGKHVFVEKPVCVDAAGYRSCIASGQVARRNGTAIVAGTMYRRQPSYMEAIKRIHDGMIGDMLSGVSYYCSAGIWYRPRKEGQTDLEYQLQNWYHFVWLCGDQIVEQAVHNIDAVNWAFQGAPDRAFGSGGQMTRPDDSEIYDHIDIDYAYGNANVSFKCRQIPGSQTRVINTFVGTKGTAYVNPGGSRIVSHDGAELFKLDHKPREHNPYQIEHADLVESIRAGNPIVEIEQVAESSLTAVMGRFAAYSGQDVSYDFTKQSKLDLMPHPLTSDTVIPEPKVQVPGQYQLV